MPGGPGIGDISGMPSGSYQYTCSALNVSNGIYTASCLTGKHWEWRTTSIEYQKLCVGGELDNFNGHLKCHDQTKIKGLPTGPWLNSCVISAYDLTKSESRTYTVYCEVDDFYFIEQYINYGDYSGQTWVNRKGYLQKY